MALIEIYLSDKEQYNKVSTKLGLTVSTIKELETTPANGATAKVCYVEGNVIKETVIARFVRNTHVIGKQILTCR